MPGPRCRARPGSCRTLRRLRRRRGRPSSARPSRSTGAATATVSACPSTAPAAGRSPAQDAAAILAHYYRGTTLGTVAPTTHHPGPRAARLEGDRIRAADDRTAGGRRGPSTASRGRSRPMPSSGSSPTTAGTATTWRLRVTAPDGRVLRDGPKPASVVVRGTTATSRLELTSKTSSYDEYRGASASAPRPTATPTVTVVNELPLETLPARRRAGRDAVELADRGARGAGDRRRSYAARRLRPGVSYYDVTDDTSSQVYRGALGEKATTNAILAAERRGRAPKRIGDRQHACSTRPAAARPRTTRTSTSRRPAPRSPAPSATCADRRTGAPDGTVLRRGVPVRHLADDDLHRRAALGLVRGRCADDRRHPACARPARSGRVRAADQRHAHRLRRDEDGLGRRLPLGLQRRAARRPIRCSGARSSGSRRSPDAGYCGPMIEPRPPLRLGRRGPARPRPADGRLPRRRMGHARPRRRRAVRAARARVVPGRSVVVDDPAQARGLPRGLPRLRSARSWPRSTTTTGRG